MHEELKRLTKAVENTVHPRFVNVKAEDLKKLIYHFNRIDKEIREQEQNFKQKEFEYRTNCQNLVSAGRLEADNMPDRLAELEKVILDYYLAKGYEVGVGGWAFNVEIESNYKSKQLLIYFRESMHKHYSQVFIAEVETTKEMFDKAIEYFSTRQNEVIECNQTKS